MYIYWHHPELTIQNAPEVYYLILCHWRWPDCHQCHPHHNVYLYPYPLQRKKLSEIYQKNRILSSYDISENWSFLFTRNPGRTDFFLRPLFSSQLPTSLHIYYVLIVVCVLPGYLASFFSWGFSPKLFDYWFLKYFSLEKLSYNLMALLYPWAFLGWHRPFLYFLSIKCFFVCFHGRPRQATDYYSLAGFLYRPLWTFRLWPPDAPAPIDAFRTLAAEVGT
jgi:hypothetical protein